MEKELIKLKTSPEIYQVLEEIKQELAEKSETALSLECTEENLKEVKKVRTDLRKTMENLEFQRKGLKNAYMQPYEEFNSLYKNVTASLTEAEKILGGRIQQVTEEIAGRREVKFREFFAEKLVETGITWLGWEQLEVNVIASKSDKYYMDSIGEKVDQITQEFLSITGLCFEEEVRAEYVKNLNLSKSIHIVSLRVDEREKAKELVVHPEEIQELQEEVAQTNRGLLPPTLVPEECVDLEPVADPILKLAFTVTAKKSKLKALKDFLVNGGYQYE